MAKKKDSKKLEIIAIIIAILSLVVSGFIGYINYSLNKDMRDLQGKVLDLEESQSKFNFVVLNYEDAERVINYQIEAYKEGEDWIENSTIKSNMDLLNKARDALYGEVNVSKANNYLSQMNLTRHAEEGLLEKKGLSSALFFLMIVLVILLLVLFKLTQSSRKTKREQITKKII